MLYGRRFFENQEDVSISDHHSLSDKWTEKRAQETGSSYRMFRTKYVLFLVATIVGSLLIFALPTLFLVKQNYQIFQTLAYDVQPQLLAHLDREYGWLLGFVITSAIFLCAIGLWIGIRITGAVIRPLNAMENHMKAVIMGNWKGAEFRQIQNNDDLHSLLDTYNYLYRSLRAQTTSDILFLQKIIVDPSQREAYQTWQNLIQNKREQIGQSSSLTETKIDLVVTSVVTVEKRHAS